MGMHMREQGKRNPNPKNLAVENVETGNRLSSLLSGLIANPSPCMATLVYVRDLPSFRKFQMKEMALANG
jgi:hypothetical protein